VAIGALPAVMIDAMNSIQPVAPSSHLVPASPVPRLAATALDGATYLIIPAVLLPLGLLLARSGIVLRPLVVNGVGLVLVILPATLWATWWEAGQKGATPGKRLLRLRVLHEQARALPSARQSVVRNMIKIALPWELGHTVALGYANMAGGEVPVWLWALTALTYGWLLGNLVLLIIPSRKPVHDRLAGTVVVRAELADYGDY